MNNPVPFSRVLLPSLLLVVLLLAACGGDSASPTPARTAAPTTAPTDAPAVEPTEEATEADATDEATTEADATDEADATAEADATEEADAGAAGVPSADNPMVRIEQQNTGLRDGPGVTAARVGSANSGDLLPVLGRSGSGQTLWYQVQLEDGSTAWVWSTVATLLPAGADVPEVEG